GSGEMTFDCRVADAIALIEFLRAHLGVDKGIVLAGAMATLTGTPLVKRRPDLVHALVATDLYVAMAANEARKYQLTMDRLRAAGNAKGVAALAAIRAALYPLRDLCPLFTGFQWSTAQMFEELMAYDAWRLGTRFEVPFFLFQGESDVVTLTTLAEEYFEEVEAPTKGLALIRDAGHFAAFTQPKRFLAELLFPVPPPR